MKKTVIGTKSQSRLLRADALRSVELFSGCGGLALGLARSGFHHEVLVERDDDAVKTLRLNAQRGAAHVADWNVVKADVRSIDWKVIERPVALVAGGPPCQPFSLGGKHRSHEDDRDMWPEAIRCVRELRPQAFLFENVRGLARPAFATYLHWITTALGNPSFQSREHESHESYLSRLRRSRVAPEYDVLVFRFNAADFGVPQKRHRLIFAGVRHDMGISLSLPKVTHSHDRLLWDQWISGSYWHRHTAQLGRRPSSNNEPRVERLRQSLFPPATLPWVTIRDAFQDLGAPNGSNNHGIQSGARRYPGHTGSPLDEPAKALKAGDHGVPGGENMMICDNRRVRYFTIREAARLQGFPDDFVFDCSWSEAMRQIGNAVPVSLAVVFGNWLREALEGAQRETGNSAA